MTVLSGEYIKLLMHRSNVFFEEGLRLAETGEHDVALFMLEQAVQLAAKAALYKLFGELPRTHKLRQLLGLLARRLREVGRIEGEQLEDLATKYRDELVILEDAYTGSRYGYMMVGSQEVSGCLKAVNELLDLIRKVISAEPG